MPARSEAEVSLPPPRGVYGSNALETVTQISPFSQVASFQGSFRQASTNE